MRSVVLSTTEAEYIALSEVVKETKFIIQLMSTMNMNVEVPITIYVDNVDAIWLSNNRTTSERTKYKHKEHTKYHIQNTSSKNSLGKG